MLTMGSGLFCSGGTLIDPAIAAVIADMGDVGHIDSGVVDVVDYVHVHMVDRRDIEEMPAVPSPALIAVTEVAEAVVDPAIPADLGSPISVVEDKAAAPPTPVAGSPQEADFWSLNPRPWHPVIIVITPGPVSRNPDISVAGADRLLVYGYLRRCDGYRYADLRQGRCRHGQKC